MQSSDVEFVRPTAMVTRAFGNGFCATIFFLIFLYFLARYVRRHATEEQASVVTEENRHSDCQPPPPSYEEVMKNRINIL